MAVSVSTGTSGWNRTKRQPIRHHGRCAGPARCASARRKHAHLRALTRTAGHRGLSGERAGNDHAAGPEPQSAGLCHRAAVGRPGLERSADDIFGFQPHSRRVIAIPWSAC